MSKASRGAGPGRHNPSEQSLRLEVIKLTKYVMHLEELVRKHGIDDLAPGGESQALQGGSAAGPVATPRRPSQEEGDLEIGPSGDQPLCPNGCGHSSARHAIAEYSGLHDEGTVFCLGSGCRCRFSAEKDTVFTATVRRNQAESQRPFAKEPATQLPIAFNNLWFDLLSVKEQLRALGLLP